MITDIEAFDDQVSEWVVECHPWVWMVSRTSLELVGMAGDGSTLLSKYNWRMKIERKIPG